MADAIVADATQRQADAVSGNAGNVKVWSDDEVKKIIEERDKAKEKVRKREEEEKKQKDEKAIEEGRLKDVLTERETEVKELRAYKAQRDVAEKLERDELLAKIKDEGDKKIAEVLSVDLLRQYVAKIESQSGGPSGAKGAKGASQDASPFKALPNETYSAYQTRLNKFKSERNANR